MLVTEAPSASARLATIVTAEAFALVDVDEKSVVPDAVALDTVAVADKVNAPDDAPAVGAIPTVAIPELSVKAVVELNVAIVELRLKVTSLPIMAAPAASFKVAFVENVPVAPIAVTVVPAKSCKVTTIEGAVEVAVEPEVDPEVELELEPEVELKEGVPASPPPPPHAVSTTEINNPLKVFSNDIFTALFIR